METMLFNDADIELMPPGNTRWMASNALSLFANGIDEEKKERAMEIRAVAGMVLDKTSKIAA